MKRGCISRTCVRSSKGSKLQELRMDSENKPSPDLHVNAGMRRRLNATYRSSVG